MGSACARMLAAILVENPSHQQTEVTDLCKSQIRRLEDGVLGRGERGKRENATDVGERVTTRTSKLPALHQERAESL